MEPFARGAGKATAAAILTIGGQERSGLPLARKLQCLPDESRPCFFSWARRASATCLAKQSQAFD
jgi:hypothetical protein